MLTSKLDEKRNKKDDAADLRSQARSISDINLPEKGSPTELLAEFLYCVMKKDYEKALQLCAKILELEPNNSTAQEFYPLIAEKLERIKNGELEDSSSESSGTFSPKSSSSSENGIYLKRRSNSEKYISYSSRNNNNAAENSDFFNSNSTASTVETIKCNTENLNFNLTLPKQSPSINKKDYLVSRTPTEIIKATKTKKTIMTSPITLLFCSTKKKILTNKNVVEKTTIEQKK